MENANIRARVNQNSRIIEFIMNFWERLVERERERERYREIQRTFAYVKINGSENAYVGHSRSQSQSSKVSESRFHEKVSLY